MSERHRQSIELAEENLAVCSQVFDAAFMPLVSRATRKFERHRAEQHTREGRFGGLWSWRRLVRHRIEWNADVPEFPAGAFRIY